MVANIRFLSLSSIDVRHLRFNRIERSLANLRRKKDASAAAPRKCYVVVHNQLYLNRGLRDRLWQFARAIHRARAMAGSNYFARSKCPPCGVSETVSNGQREARARKALEMIWSASGLFAEGRN